MKAVDKYLNRIQEQFNARIAATDIHGDFEDEWTDCYEKRCHQSGEENKYAKNYCKAQCYMTAANRAISRLNAAKSKCTSAQDPNKCVISLAKAVEGYQSKIVNARKMQDNASAKQAAFRRASGA